MRRATALAILFSAGILGQEPTVERAAVWTDTVRQGDIVVEVRALGTLGADKSAELRLPEDVTQRVKPGQKASIQGMNHQERSISGKVARLASATNGTMAITVELDGALPDWARDRITERLAGRLAGGVLTVAASEQRSQLANRQAARTRLTALLKEAVAPPQRPRVPTRPGRAANERRLEAKRQRSATKRGRRLDRRDPE